MTTIDRAYYKDQNLLVEWKLPYKSNLLLFPSDPL